MHIYVGFYQLFHSWEVEKNVFFLLLQQQNIYI